MSCDICIKVVVSRAALTCRSCGHVYCVQCIRKIVSSMTDLSARCVNCRSSIEKSEQGTFKAVLVKRQKQLLFESEMRRFPETQYFIRFDKRVRNMKKTDKLTERFINAWVTNYCIMDVPKLVEHVPLEIRGYIGSNTVRDGPSRCYDKTVHLFGCPRDGCKGYINSAYSCGLCETRVCEKCHACLTDTHACMGPDLKGIQAIAKTTKPCPKCAARIYKTEGCDQMFCTYCRTAFSWTGGWIETGNVHNPHYLEWKMSNDFDNQTRPRIALLRPHCEQHFSNTFVEYVSIIHRLSLHIEAIEIGRRFRYREISTDFNIDVRVRYLKGELSRSLFENVLHKRFKLCHVNNERCKIYTSLLKGTAEIFNRIIRDPVSDDIETEYTNAFNELFLSANSQFEILSELYHMVMPKINILKYDISWIFLQSMTNGYITMIDYSKS